MPARVSRLVHLLRSSPDLVSSGKNHGYSVFRAPAHALAGRRTFVGKARQARQGDPEVQVIQRLFLLDIKEICVL